jgi:hypothetical protein
MHNPPVTVSSAAAATLRWLVAATLLAFAGCGGETDDRPAKWSFISATIIQPTCATASCHSELVRRAGVDLHDRNTGHRSLLDGLFVRAGDPAGSPMITIMNGEGSIRMPPDFALPIADIQLISSWITAGALNE